MPPLRFHATAFAFLQITPSFTLPLLFDISFAAFIAADASCQRHYFLFATPADAMLSDCCFRRRMLFTLSPRADAHAIAYAAITPPMRAVYFVCRRFAPCRL
jgi:hypothetical protein